MAHLNTAHLDDLSFANQKKSLQNIQRVLGNMSLFIACFGSIHFSRYGQTLNSVYF